jgi:hypothetical protein
LPHKMHIYLINFLLWNTVHETSFTPTPPPHPKN